MWGEIWELKVFILYREVKKMSKIREKCIMLLFRNMEENIRING